MMCDRDIAEMRRLTEVTPPPIEQWRGIRISAQPKLFAGLLLPNAPK